MSKNTKKGIYFRRWRKWMDKLVVQFAALILATNILFMGICFIFQYKRVSRIFLQEQENEWIGLFEQSEHNINNLSEQIEYAVRTLAMDDNLRIIEKKKDLSEKELIYYATQIINQFNTIQNNYSYIRTISYYSDDGLIMKTGKRGNFINFLDPDMEKQDWFYSSDIYSSMQEKKLKLGWFGGYTKSDFGLTDLVESSDQYYISVAKRTIMGMGTIILNINMSYFADIFSGNDTERIGNSYIVDEKDRIIAAKDLSLIGEERTLADKEEIQDGIWKLVEKRMQVIAYTLPVMGGWFLVGEKPVAEIVKSTAELKNILLLSCILSACASVLMSLWWSYRKLKPLNQLCAVMQRVGNGELGSMVENHSQNEIGMLTRHFNRMSLEVKGMFEGMKKAEEDKRNMELRMLRSQINPHLISNTLNTIKWMAILNREENIAKSISLLADFLHPLFRSSSPFCTIREELGYVKTYVAIMNLRFADGFHLEESIPEEYFRYSIMRFLLQPVVENSILHGFGERGSGTIRISMETEGKDGILRVADDGCGFDEEALSHIRRKLEEDVLSEGDHVGLENVNHRLRLWYGAAYGLTIDNGEDRGGIVCIRFRLDTEI